MNKKKHISSTIFIIVLITITIFVYKKYDYNFYSKGISERGKTVFSRDSDVTTNKTSSYKIENKDYTDAMFYRKISVKQNTAYKVTCMIKTQDVEQYDNEQVAGAQIVLKGSEEHSTVISGTSDWTKVEFCFNSKNNTTIQIGFRLGGNNYKAKGIAWFSDIGIEEGSLEEDSTWNFACFIFDNINVKLDNGITLSETLTNSEVYDMKENMQKFKTTLPSLCNYKMQVEYNIIEISDPITSLTYDENNGYYVDEKDVYKLIEKYVEQAEYDHIFVCFKLPDEEKMGESNAINWVGLGNMEYCGKGFSDIRIPEDDDRTYEYSNSNTFPEEVFIHEFLHTLERNAGEYGYTVPALHSYATYGYEDDNKDGLRQWYKDYMNSNIKYNGSTIGLPSEIYNYTPVQLSDFTYSSKLDYLDEPKNVIEVIRNIVTKIENLFIKTEEQKEIEIVSN